MSDIVLAFRFFNLGFGFHALDKWLFNPLKPGVHMTFFANQWTDVYMIGTSVMKELTEFSCLIYVDDREKSFYHFLARLK